MLKSAKEILDQYWGYQDFRHPQKEIIESVLNKNDVIALLPTGGGKSICFQVPALIHEGICLVISPLIALMQDQVDHLKQRNIRAATIPSGVTQDEMITLFDNIKFGNYKFLYISPERLQSRFIQQKIKELNINLFAIDEAHCISEWGHDFRPSYRSIKTLRTLKPEVSFIALTATANKKVLQDISTSLEFKKAKIYKKSFYRENLAYQIFKIEDKLQRLIQIFTKTKTPAIVYVNSRKKTVEIANFLNANGYKSSFYHGGLTNAEKQVAFDNWMNEVTPIIVATNAFGMGIDKANVGLVIHYNLPTSIENYIQETGRAGRNQQKSFAALLYHENDITLLEQQTENSTPNIKEIKSILKSLYQHFQIAYGELPLESYSFNFKDFCKKYNFSTLKVDVVLKILSNNGILEIDSNFNQKSTLQFMVSSNAVLNYSNKNVKQKKFIDIILRTYGGLFEQETKVNEYFIAKKAGITSQQVFEELKKLEEDKIITYKAATSDVSINFIMPREDDKTINKSTKEIKAYIHQKKNKTAEFINFVRNDKVCRSIQVLKYFDEDSSQNCGICDVCIRKKRKVQQDVSLLILQLLENKESLSSSEMTQYLNVNEKDILIHLRNLLSENKISINHQNKYRLN
ncbi:RecQ family ATP-dependent DNA helicase [Polaribacter septentrionalilitoris]|uniref:RecQ family ATP-dependent DNA helicase n=1 Tax=Polaribacter septentrionalilitoris TaxID=2494657 RepID=UPI00135804BB|nr:ATP-dependent DNA helicase RecQ [Polaribacter septentrionalilitoris]